MPPEAKTRTTQSAHPLLLERVARHAHMKDINMMFISEILHEEEDHYIPPGIPEPFHEDFQQGSFAWDAEQEALLGRATELVGWRLRRVAGLQPSAVARPLSSASPRAS